MHAFSKQGISGHAIAGTNLPYSVYSPSFEALSVRSGFSSPSTAVPRDTCSTFTDTGPAADFTPTAGSGAPPTTDYAVTPGFTTTTAFDPLADLPPTTGCSPVSGFPRVADFSPLAEYLTESFTHGAKYIEGYATGDGC
ncbi:hypothetical protein C1H76_3038 [Elsinoe australis]|uniref:Uncharacterized protein n=1 Tax=Elsinoe australis TaxID=40998 RepID=A0A4V6DUG0_9PEZI|nr:hypothetical protein C1H76_3038 [Elsinoe australis]